MRAEYHPSLPSHCLALAVPALDNTQPDSLKCRYNSKHSAKPRCRHLGGCLADITLIIQQNHAADIWVAAFPAQHVFSHAKASFKKLASGNFCETRGPHSGFRSVSFASLGGNRMRRTADKDKQPTAACRVVVSRESSSNREGTSRCTRNMRIFVTRWTPIIAQVDVRCASVFAGR